MNLKQNGTILLALALSIGLAGSALAQGAAPGGQAGPGGGQGGQVFGGFGGPGGMMMRGPGGANNPMMSNPLGLLQRIEVQNELGLDLKQKRAIEALQGESENSMRDKIQQTIQGAGVDFQSYRNASPQQRQQQMETMRQKMQELGPQIAAAVTSWQGELSDKIKAILKPEQVTRLYQLDKQRRGPLCMADAKVAEELELSPETRKLIQEAYTQNQQDTQKVTQEAFQSMRDANSQGRPPQLPDFTSKLSPWKQKMDKVRKAGEEKALAALTDEEKVAWKKAIGAPFTFRADLPQNNNIRRGGRQGGFGGGF